jgi:hypothetical protein
MTTATKNMKATSILAVILPATSLFIFGAGALLATDTAPTRATQQFPITEKQSQISEKELKSAADRSLWRLKHVIKKEGFYSARVALNVWRSTATEAGVFDQAVFDDYKKQIYEKSIRNNRQCFEYAVEHENYTDAEICLHTWKAHCEEMGLFDADLYEQMRKRIK